MIFEFAVRRLRWLARVPFAPQIFDAMLLAWTAAVHRERIAVMEALEARALELPNVQLRRHRFGGAGFECNGREFAHFHGNGLLDVHLTRETDEQLVGEGRALTHHVFGPSAWVSFWLRTKADLPRAASLIALGANKGN